MASNWLDLGVSRAVETESIYLSDDQEAWAAAQFMVQFMAYGRDRRVHSSALVAAWFEAFDRGQLYDEDLVYLREFQVHHQDDRRVIDFRDDPMNRRNVVVIPFWDNSQIVHDMSGDTDVMTIYGFPRWHLAERREFERVSPIGRIELPKGFIGRLNERAQVAGIREALMPDGPGLTLS